MFCSQIRCSEKELIACPADGDVRDALFFVTCGCWVEDVVEMFLGLGFIAAVQTHQDISSFRSLGLMYSPGIAYFFAARKADGSQQGATCVLFGNIVKLALVQIARASGLQ